MMKTLDAKAVVFPDWTPAVAIESYRYQVDRELKYNAPTGHSRAEMLYRLCTFESMRTVWKKLDAVYVDKRETVKHSQLFASVAICGYFGPTGEQLKPPKEHKEWLSEVIDTSKKLANLIEGSFNFDRYLADRHQDDYMRWLMFGQASLASEGIKLKDEILVMIDNLREHDGFSAVLREFAGRVPKLAKPAISRPNAPEARRTYFIRALTDYFIEYFGKPHRKLVAIVTAAAFDDEAVTERQVTRVASSTDTKKRKTTK